MLEKLNQGPHCSGPLVRELTNPPLTLRGTWVV